MATWDSLTLCQYDASNDDFSKYESALNVDLVEQERIRIAWKLIDDPSDADFNEIDYTFWDNKREQAKDHIKKMILSYYRQENDAQNDKFVTDYIENPTILKDLAIFWSLHYAATDLSFRGEDYFVNKSNFYEKRATEEWNLINDRIEIDIDEDGYIDPSPSFTTIEIAI